MKKKIAYLIITVSIATATFFVGKSIASNGNHEEMMKATLENIEYWEVTDTGLDLYDYDGNLYQW